MTYRVYLDCFTSLDELKPKERSDPEAVLNVLRCVKRFSVWDMDNEALRDTVMGLKRTGKIRTNDPDLCFPWVGVTVLEP